MSDMATRQQSIHTHTHTHDTSTHSHTRHVCYAYSSEYFEKEQQQRRWRRQQEQQQKNGHFMVQWQKDSSSFLWVSGSCGWMAHRFCQHTKSGALIDVIVPNETNHLTISTSFICFVGYSIHSSAQPHHSVRIFKDVLHRLEILILCGYAPKMAPIKIPTLIRWNWRLTIFEWHSQCR